MFPGTAFDSSSGIPATSAGYRELLGRTQDRRPASAGDNRCSAGADTWLRRKQFVAAGTLRLQRIAGKNGSNEQASGLSPLGLKTTSKRDLCRFYRTPDLETDLESLPRPANGSITTGLTGSASNRRFGLRSSPPITLQATSGLNWSNGGPLGRLVNQIRAKRVYGPSALVRFVSAGPWAALIRPFKERLTNRVEAA